MALPSSGAISFSSIRTEFGLTGSLSLGDLYRGANGDGTIKDNYGENDSVPLSGAIDISDFYDLYLEGSITNKLSNFDTYRSSALITTGRESGETLVTHTGSLHIGNPHSRYQSFDDVPNTQTKSSLASVSQWSTLVGIAGMPGGSNLANSITSSHTQYNYYHDTYAGNANFATTQINLPINQLGNLNYRFNRQASNKWASGGLIILPGKWQFDRRYVATGSGWGINTLGISNDAPSVTLQRNEIAVWARERGGDGASSGWWTNTSNCDYVELQGHWYNTGCWGVCYISNSATSSAIYSYNEQPDATWILEEVL